MQRRLMLFAKCPRLGQVKTRLVPPLDTAQALALHEAFLADQIALLRSLAARARPELWLDGPWRAPEPPLVLAEQQGPDLGARLLAAFRARPASAAVVIAGDAPTLPAARVLEAFATLEAGAEAVCAPASDGGYVLLGMDRARPELFDAIPWGGPEVLRRTVERARSARIDLRLVEGWYDVDEPDALERLAQELRTAGAAARAPATARCLAALGLA